MIKINTLYCIRHGETEWNADKKMQGRTDDINLNNKGIDQAYEARDNIDFDNIDICLCSPLKRARKTADIIVGDKLPIIYDEMLVERGFGLLEGKVTTKEIMARHWDYKLNDKEYGVESIQDCMARVEEFLKKLNDTYDDKNILIISHGCFIKLMYYSLMGYDENTDFNTFFPDNCKIYKFDLPRNKVKTKTKI